MLRDCCAFYWIYIAYAFTSLEMAFSKENGKFANTANGCREFSSNLHKAIARNSRENILNSPLSMHILLSYLFHGSDGLTAKQFITALSLSNTENVHVEYKDLLLALNSMDKIELHLVDGLFIQEGVELFPLFQSKGTDFYNFSIQKVNFGDNIESADLINSWVTNSTNNKIKEIISPDDLSDAMKVVLVNAIYFKGQWQNQFSEGATEKKVFHSSKILSKHVPTMYKQFRYSHGTIASLNARFLEIPYMDGDVDMIIVLPDEIEGLKFLEENFDWNVIVNAERSMGMTQLSLPKFKIEATMDMKAILGEIGFKVMFEDAADFGRMSAVPLKVDSIIQKTFLEINEAGSEAAAATVARMMLKRSIDIDEPDEFVVDHPFIVAIRHVPSNIPLFISSVRDIIVAPEKDEL